MKIKLIAIIIALLFFASYNKTALQIYYSGQTRGDLTNFSQAMYNSSLGRYMQNTFNYSLHNFWGGRELNIPTDSSIFGIHLNPILTLFIPIYKLYPNPTTLITIQTFLACLGSIFIVFLAQKNKITLIGIVGQILFLSHPSLRSAVYSEFHAYTLSIFFVSGFIYFISTKPKHWTTIIFFILSLSIQENVSMTIFLYCLILSMFNKKNRTYYLILAITSIAYFFISTKIIIPHLSNYKSYIFEAVYGNKLGGSFYDMAQNSLKNPQLFIEVFFSKENIKYIGSLTRPAIFSIFSPVLYIASVFSLLSSLISSSSLLKSQAMHYEALFVPFVYFAWLNTFKKISQKHGLFSIMLALLTLTSLIGSINKINTNLSNKFANIKPFDPQLEEIIPLVQANASLSTQDHLSVFFTNRSQLYLFPVYSTQSDYVLLSKKDIWPLKEEEQSQEIKKLNKTHNLNYENTSYLLYKKIILK